MLVSALPGLPPALVTPVGVLPALAFARDVTLALTLGAPGPAPCTASRHRPASGAVGAGLGPGLGRARSAVVALSLARRRLGRRGAAGSAATGVGNLLTDALAGRALVVQLACLVWAPAAGRSRRDRHDAPGRGGPRPRRRRGPRDRWPRGALGQHGGRGRPVAVHVAAVCVWVGGLAVVERIGGARGGRGPVTCCPASASSRWPA